MTTSTGLWVNTVTHAVVTSAPAEGIQIVAPGTVITDAVQALIDYANGVDWSLSGSQRTTAEGFAPDWQAFTRYRKDQLVTHSGSLYQAKADFTSAAAWSAGDWNAVGGSGTSAGVAIGDYRFYSNYSASVQQDAEQSTRAVVLADFDPGVADHEPNTSDNAIPEMTSDGKITFPSPALCSVYTFVQAAWDVAPDAGTVGATADPLLTGEHVFIADLSRRDSASGDGVLTSFSATRTALVAFKAGGSVQLSAGGGSGDFEPNLHFTDIEIQVVRLA